MSTLKPFIEFGLIKKIYLKGKPSKVSSERYIKFMEEKDNVLDISTDDKERIHILETTIGIIMSKAEDAYLK